ncbi:MAG: hypothetical protein ACM3JI_00555 [Anaerolineae bacterium]
MPSASAVAENPGRYIGVAINPYQTLVIDLDHPSLSSRIHVLEKSMAILQRDYQQMGNDCEKMSQEHKDMFRRIGKITENNLQVKKDLAEMKKTGEEFRAFLDQTNLNLQKRKATDIAREIKEAAEERKHKRKMAKKQHSSHGSHSHKSHSTSPPSIQEDSPSLVTQVSKLLLSPMFAFLALIKWAFSDDNKKAP